MTKETAQHKKLQWILLMFAQPMSTKSTAGTNKRFFSIGFQCIGLKKNQQFNLNQPAFAFCYESSLVIVQTID